MQGGDDHRAREVRGLVIEPHKLCIGLLCKGSVDEAAIGKILNQGLGPYPLDTRFRLGYFREDEIIGPEDVPRCQRRKTDSTHSLPRIWSNAEVATLDPERRKTGTVTTVVCFSIQHSHSSKAALSFSDCSSVPCIFAC